MIKRLLCMLFAVGVLMGIGFPALAAGASGSIQLQVEAGVVTLYRVGDPVDTGYRLTEEYGKGLITLQDAISPNLAMWLAERVHGGVEMEPNEEGIIEYPDLPEGLYLLIQTETPEGEKPFAPFLVSIPWDGIVWDIQADPTPELETPKTADDSQILLWVMMMVMSCTVLTLCLNRKRR